MTGTGVGVQRFAARTSAMVIDVITISSVLRDRAHQGVHETMIQSNFGATTFLPLLGVITTFVREKTRWFAYTVENDIILTITRKIRGFLR
jgi:hypothetical protein